MAPFSKADVDRLDWELLREGAVTLYWRRALFERDVAWLREHDYSVHLVDCSDVVKFCDQMSRALRFAEHFGYEPWTGNLNALNDAIGCLEFGSHAGVAFCFSRIDLLAAADRQTAQAMLDILDLQSRECLLLGHRLLALAQTDDAAIQLEPVGARAVKWNREEWLDANRGL